MKINSRSLPWVLVAAVAIIVALVSVFGGKHHSPVHPAAPVGATAPAVAPSAGDDSVVTPSAPDTAEPARVQVADGFARTLVRRDLPGPAWLAAIRPYVTPQLAAQYTGIDPASAVPADQVLSAPTPLPGGTGQYSVDVTGPADGAATLVVTVVDVPGGPRVATADYLLPSEPR